jgi:hypothetical protein
MEEPAVRRRDGPTGRTLAACFVGSAVAAVIVGSLFLSPFLARKVTTPYGFDTPHYIWRSNLVIAQGLNGLHAIDPLLRINPKPDRPAYPVFASLALHVARIPPGGLAFVVPVVFAVALGMAAGAFAVEVLEEPPWAFPVYLAIVGLSLVVVRTAVGSSDNLQVDSVLIAGGTAAMLFSVGRRGGVAALLLFLAAFQIHWILSSVFMLLLFGVAVVLLPFSYRRWREGLSPWSTPSVRMGAVVAGSLGLGLSAVALTPDFHFAAPVITLKQIEDKVKIRIPLLRVPLSVAIAVLGAIVLWWPRSRIRRFGLALLALWVLSIPLGFALYAAKHHHFPVYRVVEFALALPILAAALVVGIARLLVARLRLFGAVAGATLIAAATVVAFTSGRNMWEVSPQIMTPQRVQQVATASRYLTEVRANEPIVFVSNIPTYTPTDRVIRAGLPGDLVPLARLYVGTSDDLLAGRQTAVEEPGPFRSASRVSWRGVQEIVDKPYIALYLTSLNPTAPLPTKATLLAPGVFLLKGPQPAFPIEAAPRPEPDRGKIVVDAIVLLAFVLLPGLGWSAGLLDVSWLSRVGLAPAFGMATLMLAGIPVAMIGKPLGGVTSWAIVVGTALAGWIVLVARELWRRRNRSRAPSVEVKGEVPTSTPA